LDAVAEAELLEDVCDVRLDGRFADVSVCSMMITSTGIAAAVRVLSRPRPRDILQLIAGGLSNAEIGEQL
jgi:DNA-binding NarL/FixJ family response regulator